MGTLSTPVIDRASSTLYVVSVSKPENNNTDDTQHRLYKINMAVPEPFDPASWVLLSGIATSPDSYTCSLNTNNTVSNTCSPCSDAAIDGLCNPVGPCGSAGAATRAWGVRTDSRGCSFSCQANFVSRWVIVSACRTGCGINFTLQHCS
jgi:hypothetical protein